MLRRILLTSAGAMALTGAALAADLRPPPPPVYVPPPSWTGFYAGLNAGGTWSGVKTLDTVAADVFDNGEVPGLASTSAVLANTNAPLHPTAGFIGGGQIGYNYQFYNSFLAGVEADIQGTSSDFRAEGVFSQAVVGPGETLKSGHCFVSECRLARHRSWPSRLSVYPDFACVWDRGFRLWSDECDHQSHAIRYWRSSRAQFLWRV